MTENFGLAAFRYANEPHIRRHGPNGYSDYKSFKQWLRDEFGFRCVFCLVRERWCHDGSHGFGVDHLVPKSLQPDLDCSYDNLIYLCNSSKRISPAIDPCKSAISTHIRFEEDGTAVALTREGRHVINALNLNYLLSKEYRRRKISSLSHWHDNGDVWSIAQDLAYPDDLPELDGCRCNNVRPGGIENSYYEQRRRNELPDTY